ASQEQTQGIEQINQAITQMDQVTQQNAALVEEAAAAAASLQEQASGLSQVVSVFKLGQEQQQQLSQGSAARHEPGSYQTVHRQPPVVKPAIDAPRRKPASETLPTKTLVAASSSGAAEWEEF
ncbi:MAG: methyl-accepting chemotaxis protein, partial [Polaromonas sp.]